MRRWPRRTSERGVIEVAELLTVTALTAGYGRTPVVFDVDVTVGPGEVVGLFGHNGAGKTTLVRAVHGLITPMSGTITFDGFDLTRCGVDDAVQRGVALIPSERFVFPELTVYDNIRLGVRRERDKQRREVLIDEVLELFPVLRDRRLQAAGTMSGGQQRMVSLAMALVGQPRLLLLDEPSLGLAPVVVEQIFDRVRALADTTGLGVILLEQNIGAALRVIDRAVVMRSGRVVLSESATALRSRTDLWELF